MKINPINQSEAVSKVMNVNSRSFAGEKISVDITDRVELSEGAKKYAEHIRNAKAAMEASEAREAEKASDIASRIQSNAYRVSDEDVVGNILRGFPTHV